MVASEAGGSTPPLNNDAIQAELIESKRKFDEFLASSSVLKATEEALIGKAISQFEKAAELVAKVKSVV